MFRYKHERPFGGPGNFGYSMSSWSSAYYKDPYSHSYQERQDPHAYHSTPSGYSARSTRRELEKVTNEELKTLQDEIESGAKKEVALQERAVDDEQFVTIVSSLSKEKACVVKLVLPENLITDKGIERAAPLLRENIILVEMDLSRNKKLGEAAAKHFLEILRTNFHITAINLFLTGISDFTLRQLQCLITRNEEIAKERKQNEYYCVLAMVLREAQFPKAVIDTILLEFFIDAKTPEARRYIKESLTLFEDAIKFAEGLDKEGLSALALLKMPSGPAAAATLSSRLQAVQGQFRVAINDSDLSESECTPLVFSDPSDSPTSRLLDPTLTTPHKPARRCFDFGSCVVS